MADLLKQLAAEAARQLATYPHIAGATVVQGIIDEARKRDEEILRLVDALAFAHAEGFEWPVDPLPFGSLAHDLFIWRGNDPERIAAKQAEAPNGN